MGEKSLARRNVVIVLGVVCIVLAGGLVGMSVFFTSIIGDENNKISALNSQISELESNVTSLQEQLGGLLTPTARIEDIVSVPQNWVNATVVVEGKLSGSLAWMTAISWYYELSTNGTVLPQDALGPDCIGVDLRHSREYSAENVVVIGVVKKGIIGTIIVGRPPIVSYYIEAEFVVPK
jgi:hypothetical protein